MKYVKAFAASSGKAAGSEAKIIVRVISRSSSLDGEKQWEDAALVHYLQYIILRVWLAAKNPRSLTPNTRLGRSRIPVSYA